MKISNSIRRWAMVMAAAMFGMAGTETSRALMSPQIVTRPLTPGDIATYGLPSTTQVSGGLRVVGLGQPAYFEAQMDITVGAGTITNVVWSLTKPIGSSAVLATSPLGTNVPIYEPADRLVYQVAGGAKGRVLLRPDRAGQYTINAIVMTTAGNTSLSNTINAGTYMGLNTCALCHSGGRIATNKVDPWQMTAHASIFTEGIDGLLGHYSASCLKCHTVGYDTNTNAVNDGFDDIASEVGWTFPAVQTNGNWAAMDPSLRNVANIQCENCHGPGSQHAYALGPTNLISATLSSGDCNVCHDAPSHHIFGTEWYNSLHAVATREPSGPSRASCVGCHTGAGFIDRMKGVSPPNTSYSAIGCQTCHEPHGETTPTNNPHLLRSLASVTLKDGSIITADMAGNGLLCINCHMSRQNATNYVETATGDSRFGPHYGPQSDLFLGVNGVTYGKTIPSSAHRDAIGDSCVTCHMQATDHSGPAFLLAGGHTWKMSATKNGTNYFLTTACQQCHGAITDFNLPREDFNGDGFIEGVQTEVQKLLNRLALLLPPVGTPKSSLSIDASWTRQQLRAAYNYLNVQKDGSLGVHNAAYAVGLLKASIADLTGDANNDNLPDWWQIQYFGSITNAYAAPGYIASSDGVPNWLKYTLGLNPMTPGLQLPGGVVWVNGDAIGGGTNTIHIYTAAEIAFDTDQGKSYQVQAISSLTGGWQNVGNPIAGTGSAISYFTPMRQNVQQYFRVTHSP